MEEQRTIITSRNAGQAQPGSLVTVAAFGASRQTQPGKSVAETLAELGWRPEPYQSVRVNGAEVNDLGERQLQPGEVVTVTNLVRGG